MGVVLVQSVEEEGEGGDGETKKTTNWENSQIKGYEGKLLDNEEKSIQKITKQLSKKYGFAK